MRTYRFLFDEGEVYIEADSLGAATAKLAEHPAGSRSGFLRTVECGVDRTSPQYLKRTFEIELDDAKYLVEWDSEGASGDGWNEPRQEAHAWITDIWMWQAYTKGGGRWVRIHEDMLKPSTKEYIEDECDSHAFPGGHDD